MNGFLCICDFHTLYPKYTACTVFIDISKKFPFTFCLPSSSLFLVVAICVQQKKKQICWLQTLKQKQMNALAIKEWQNWILIRKSKVFFPPDLRTIDNTTKVYWLIAVKATQNIFNTNKSNRKTKWNHREENYRRQIDLRKASQIECITESIRCFSTAQQHFDIESQQQQQQRRQWRRLNPYTKGESTWPTWFRQCRASPFTLCVFILVLRYFF